MDFDVLTDGLGFTEGPVSFSDGTLGVVSVTEGMVHRISADGEVLESLSTGGGPNGLALGKDDAIYVAQNGGIFGGKPGAESGIQLISNGAISQIVTGVGAPNDLCFGPDGRLYFTDPRAESDPTDPATAQPGRLYSCEPDGSDLRKLLEGPRFINGLAFDPSGETLYLVETSAPHQILRCRFDDGSVGEPEVVIVLDGGFPDGIAIAEDGSLWVGATADMSVHVYGEDGTLRRKLACGDGSMPTNLCFGRDDPSTLFVTASGQGAVLKATVDASGLELYPFR